MLGRPVNCDALRLLLRIMFNCNCIISQLFSSFLSLLFAMIVAGCCCNAHTTSHHITSHHITSHHITSHHITSHHITSHHVHGINSQHQPQPTSNSPAPTTSSSFRQALLLHVAVPPIKTALKMTQNSHLACHSARMNFLTIFIAGNLIRLFVLQAPSIFTMPSVCPQKSVPSLCHQKNMLSDKSHHAVALFFSLLLFWNKKCISILHSILFRSRGPMSIRCLAVRAAVAHRRVRCCAVALLQQSACCSENCVALKSSKEKARPVLLSALLNSMAMKRDTAASCR
jgi:hypothetical protein